MNIDIKEEILVDSDRCFVSSGNASEELSGNFSKMEEMLIEYVRSNPLLYDPTNREYRNQHSRKVAWDEIGEKFGITGNECKENWNKLRNAYIQAKHRRTTKSGQAAKSLCKWKFEEEMAFLNPTLATRKTRGNTEDGPNNEDDEGTREEIGLFPLDETNSQVELSEMSESNHTTAEIIGNPMTNGSDFATTFAPPSAMTVRPSAGKKRLSSSFQEIITIMKDNQRLCSQVLLQGSSAASSNEDECELFFLSMAKHVKKLRPDEQIKVKMEVSKIVLGAALQAARGSSSTENPGCQITTIASPSLQQHSSTPSPL